MADNLAAVLDEIQEDRPQPEVPGLPFLPGAGIAASPLILIQLKAIGEKAWEGCCAGERTPGKGGHHPREAGRRGRLRIS